MLLLVPSCAECNGIASNELHHSMHERRMYVKNKLRKKYGKLLAMPDWTDSEIAELEGRLQESVLNTLEAKRRVALRVAYRGLTLEK